MPGTELVAPEAIELEAAGPLGPVGGQADGDGAIRPGEPALGGLEPRPVPGRCDGEQATGPLDHGIAVIGGRGGDQADAAGLARLDPAADQLGGGAGLAGGAAAQEQPGAPIPGSAGRWAARARGWMVHSPAGSPQGQPPANQSQREPSAIAGGSGPSRASARRMRRAVLSRVGMSRPPLRAARRRPPDGTARPARARSRAPARGRRRLFAQSPFDVGQLAGQAGVVRDAHEFGQDGPGGLEADGFAPGVLGQLDDLSGRGGGMRAELLDGSGQHGAADGLGPIADLGGAGPGVDGAIGDVVGPGPVGDAAAAGQVQGELVLLNLVVDLGHAGAIGAPLAVLDPVLRSAG